jgi:hypothetical protein
VCKFRFLLRQTKEAGEKIKGSNNAFFSPISLLEDWHSQTTYWSLGVLGSPYKIMSVQRASPWLKKGDKTATTSSENYHETSRCILHFNLCPNTHF